MNDPNAAAPDNGLAIPFLDGSRTTWESLNELLEEIREGNYIYCSCLSMDEYCEEDFFSIDLKNGWVALMYNTWDEEGDAHGYLPVNPEYEDSEEDAPVDIGGQTPVLKRNALTDLNLAAECVLHFAKTLELYPNVKWEEMQ